MGRLQFRLTIASSSKHENERRRKKIKTYICFLCSLYMAASYEFSSKNEIEIGQKGLKVK
jgi:hypothetical protein